MAFVKLDTAILDSTVWLDRDGRDMWITALLLAEPREFPEQVTAYKVRTLEPLELEIPAGWYGFVPGSGPGLVNRARIEMEAGLAALERLSSPDPHSRSPEWEGRRLVRVAGGYLIFNYMRERDRDHSAAARMRRLRARKKALTEAARIAGLLPSDTPNSDAVTPNSDAEAPNVTPVRPNVTHSRWQIADANADAEGRVLRSTAGPDATPEPAKIAASFDYRKLFPEEFHGDIDTAVGASRNPEGLARELAAMVQGMRGPKVDPALLGMAVRDLLLKGWDITGLTLTTFIRRHSQEAGAAIAEEQADEFEQAIDEVRKKRARGSN